MTELSRQSEDPRYPTGTYHPPETVDAQQRAIWIEELGRLPGELRTVVADLDNEQLDTAYREGGWTVRQVVHHLADSHVNSYVRFRLALTEDTPAIKSYQEAAWAELKDARSGEIGVSLALLDALHRRWVILLSSMGEPEFARSFHHSDFGKVTLVWTLGLYAWHGAHHVAQITRLRERRGW